jgi:hypothetical protein
VNDADRQRAETLRAVFDPGTPDAAVRAALARVLRLRPPPPSGHPVVLGTTQGLAGYTVERGRGGPRHRPAGAVRRPADPAGSPVRLRADRPAPVSGQHAVTGSDVPEVCPWCPHPYDPHVFVARSYALFGLPGGAVLEVPDGGTVSCPVPGCDCQSTWSLGIPTETG